MAKYINKGSRTIDSTEKISLTKSNGKVYGSIVDDAKLPEGAFGVISSVVVMEAGDVQFNSKGALVIPKDATPTLLVNYLEKIED